MQIIVTKDYYEMSQKAADIISDQIACKPDSILGLPTGETPLQIYRLLVEASQKGKLDFSKVATFNLDEYVGLSSEDKESYASYMSRTFFSQVGLPKTSTHIFNGRANNLKEECEQYEEAITKAGGLDLTLLGIGVNGHIAFNEPGTSFTSVSHVTALSLTTIENNKIHFANPQEVPSRALTMGIRTIMRSRKIIILASGPRKANAVRELVNGPVTKKFPASVLQTHDDVILIVDEAAATELEKSAYQDQAKDEFTIYHDRTLPKGKSIAIISPHPDDSCISLGGTITLLSPHNKVEVLVMTTGHRAYIPDLSKSQKIKKRVEEARNEAKVLGTTCHCLALNFYESGKLEEKDVETLFSALVEIDPEIVFLPFTNDPHPTHKMSTEIALQAVKKLVAAKKHNVELWYYESPWALFQPGNFNIVVQIPREAMKKKLEAIKMHQSQVTRTPFDDVAEAMSIMRAAVVPEQIVSSYGKAPPKLERHAEVFALSVVTHGQKLVESFSGVRGIYGIDLNEEVAEGYAFTYGTWLKHKIKKNPRVVLGRDSRPSGKSIMEAMAKGLQRAHCHIFNVGVGTTPLIQFEVRNRDCHGGIIITASHNEPHWNGFKFLWTDGGILTPEQMEEVIVLFHSKGEGTEAAFSVHYIKFILKTLGPKVLQKIKKAAFKIVVDPNGGAMIVLIKKLFEKLNIKTVELNMDLGVFKHKVEPTKEALKHMGPIIKDEKADMGVAWDCDGDRIEIVLPNGKNLSGHYVLALLVDEILSKRVKNRVVVVNNATSRVVTDIAARYKAKVVETDVGEPNVVKKMYELGAPVGGEGSCGGGIVPPSRCRDGVLTLFKILGMLAERKQTILEIIGEYPPYYTSHKNLKLGDHGFDQLRRKMEKHYSQYPHFTFGGKKGAFKVQLSSHSFVLFRTSKTEPNLLRIVADSPTRNETHQIIEEAVALVS